MVLAPLGLLLIALGVGGLVVAIRGPRRRDEAPAEPPPAPTMGKAAGPHDDAAKP